MKADAAARVQVCTAHLRLTTHDFRLDHKHEPGRYGPGTCGKGKGWSADALLELWEGVGL
jgi:hypothetical protein